MGSFGRRALKTAIIIVVSLCIIAGVTILFIPTIFSTTWGNERLITTLNERLPGKLHISNFSLSWFGKQKIHGLTLYDPRGEPVLNFDTFETNTPLLTLLSKGPIGANTHLNSLHADLKKTPSGKTNLEEALGIEILDELLNSQKPELSNLLQSLAGDSLAVNLIEETQNDELSWKVELTSKKLNIVCIGSIKDGILHINSEGTYYLENTPLRYRFETKLNQTQAISSVLQPSEILFSLDGVPTAIVDEFLDTKDIAANTFGNHLSFNMQSALDDPQTLRLSLFSEKVDIPTILLHFDQYNFQDNSFEQSNLSGNLFIETVVFKHSRERAAIHSINIPWKTRNGLKNVAFNFSATPSLRGLSNGTLTGDVSIQSINAIEDAHVKLGMKGHNIPVEILEKISGRSELGPVLGKSVNMDISANIENLNGPVQALLSGDQGRIYLNARTANHQLFLNEPFVVTTNGSNRLSREVLSKFAPVFREMVSSEGQLKLTISPENFSLPLLPYKLEQIYIGKAVIEMNKLTFNNSGDVRELLSALRTSRSEKITVWTTPLYFTVENGILNVSRMDMLIMDRYPIATWGKIDFLKDNVHMIIGVTGTALSQALNIDGLDKNTMVQIPVRGNISNARIDSSKATTKIGSLIAQSNGGPEGLVFGTILDIANGKEGKVPSPMTSPLPWEGREFSREERLTVETEKNNPSKDRADPMKEIQKEASNFLKGLFK